MSEVIQELILDPVTQALKCPHCGHNKFNQTVIASNLVTFTNTQPGWLKESDDFTGTWVVQERCDLRCHGCDKRIAFPDNIQIE